MNFSIKAEDPLTVLYYANSAHNFADVVFHVNRTMEYGDYKVRVLFVRAIHVRLFDKILLKKYIKDNYHKSCARVIAWDDTEQEMEAKKVHSKHGMLWGTPQVAYLRWKCTGTPIAIDKHNYLTEYRVRIRGVRHVQCNCIMLITVQSAENRVRGELEVKIRYFDLFGVDSN